MFPKEICPNAKTLPYIRVSSHVDVLGKHILWLGIGGAAVSKCACTGSPLGVFERDAQSKRGMLMTPMVGGGGLASSAMQPATVAGSHQGTATMIKRQGPGGRTVAGNALLICTKGDFLMRTYRLLLCVCIRLLHCRLHAGKADYAVMVLASSQVGVAMWPELQTCWT